MAGITVITARPAKAVTAEILSDSLAQSGRGLREALAVLR